MPSLKPYQQDGSSHLLATFAEQAGAPQAPTPEPPPFKVGDRVRIARKVNTPRVGWSPAMDGTLGTVGVVLSVDVDGDLRINTKDDWWWYSPEALDLLPPLGEVRRLAGGLVLTDDGTITMPGVDGMEIPPPPVGEEMTQAEQDAFYDAHYPEEAQAPRAPAKDCGRYMGDNYYCALPQQPGSDWCVRCTQELRGPK